MHSICIHNSICNTEILNIFILFSATDNILIPFSTCIKGLYIYIIGSTTLRIGENIAGIS